MSASETRRRSRLRVLLATVPLALLLLALVPGSASAQTGGSACEGRLTGEGRQAELSFSCNFNVSGLEIFSNKDARVSGDFKGREGQGREGFVCPQPLLQGPPGQQGGDTFGEAAAICEGGLSAGNTATGTLVTRDDVCDPLALRVIASSLGSAEDEFIVRIQGCGRDDDGTGDACEGKLTGAGRQAELSFSCNFNVRALEIFSNKDATIRGDIKGEDREGFVCLQPVLQGPTGRQGADTFGEESAVCEGQLSAGNTATATLIARDDVCDPLALRVNAFSLGAPEDAFITQIQGCGRDDDTRPGEDGGTRLDEDEGQIPRGGVDSGGGGGAPADAPGAGLLAAAGLLLAAALGLGIARVRG